MNVPDDAAAKGLRGWWASPPRPGMQRLINPPAYRHLRVSLASRILRVASSRPALAHSYSRTPPTVGQPSSWFLRR